jgi:hypothetical protein
LPTVQRLETSKGSLKNAELGTIEKLLTAFKQAGIDFPDPWSISYRRVTDQQKAE